MKDKNKNEKRVESYLKRMVKTIGGLSYKFSSPAHRGVPDQIVILPTGNVWFIEVKAPDGNVSKLQQVVIDDLLSKYANVEVVYCIEDVNKWIKRAL